MITVNALFSGHSISVKLLVARAWIPCILWRVSFHCT